jgi:hypothetical protein
MTGLPPGYSELMQQPIYIEFPIGQISFTAGRDAISYDKTTQANLIAGFDRVVNELPKLSQAKFDACKTKWEAHCLYGEMVNSSVSGSILRILSQHKRLSFTWQGQAITTSSVTITMKGLGDPIVTALWANSTKSKRSVGEEAVQVGAARSIVFYIDDMPKGAITRLRSYRYQNQPDHDLYLLATGGIDVAEKRVEIDKMLADLGDPPFVLASTLPAKKRNPASMLSKKLNKVYTVNKNNYYASGFEEAADDIDIEEGGFYIPVSRQKPINATTGNPYINFNSIMRQAAILGLIPDGTEIVAVNPSQMKKFEENEEWVEIMGHIKEQMITYLKSNKVIDTIAQANSYNQLRMNGGIYAINSIIQSKHLSDLPNTHELATLCASCTAQAKLTHKFDMNGVLTMAGWVDVKIDDAGGVPGYDFNGEWNKITNKYPMLRIMSSMDNTRVSLLIKYIKDMDRLAEYDQKASSPTIVKVAKP